MSISETGWTVPEVLARSKMPCWLTRLAALDPAAMTVPSGPAIALGAEA
jgi:hypothetical protein